MSGAVPDEVIDGYLGTLFGSSEPGQDLHHLLVAVAAPVEHTALGVFQPSDLQVRLYAIAPTPDVDAHRFIAKVIVGAIVEAHQAGEVIYFAGLATEAYTVVDDGTELTENLARRLTADGKLEQHPAAVEVTLLYAACLDGRRWTGEHFLTGPKAGTRSGPQVHVGALAPREGGLHQQLVRRAVGL